jgi:hypothetical protein
MRKVGSREPKNRLGRFMREVKGGGSLEQRCGPFAQAAAASNLETFNPQMLQRR